MRYEENKEIPSLKVLKFKAWKSRNQDCFMTAAWRTDLYRVIHFQIVLANKYAVNLLYSLPTSTSGGAWINAITGKPHTGIEVATMFQRCGYPTGRKVNLCCQCKDGWTWQKRCDCDCHWNTCIDHCEDNEKDNPTVPG